MWENETLELRSTVQLLALLENKKILKGSKENSEEEEKLYSSHKESNKSSQEI